jgi:hypothetical protein
MDTFPFRLFIVLLCPYYDLLTVYFYLFKFVPLEQYCHDKSSYVIGYGCFHLAFMTMRSEGRRDKRHMPPPIILSESVTF